MCNRPTLWILVSFVFIVLADASAQAQPENKSSRSRHTMAKRSRVQLAFGKSVQNELKLSEEQQIVISDLNRHVQDETTKLHQLARFQKIEMPELFARLAKQNADASTQLQTLLNEQQRTRLDELFVQINDSAALNDEQVVNNLGLSDTQRSTLNEARQENSETLRAAFPTFREMTKEQQKAKFDSLQKENRERLLAVLTDSQQEKFETMKGEKIEFDHAEFRIRRSRTNRTRKVSKQRGAGTVLRPQLPPQGERK